MTTTKPSDLVVFPEDKFLHEFGDLPDVLDSLRDTCRSLATLSTGLDDKHRRRSLTSAS